MKVKEKTKLQAQKVRNSPNKEKHEQIKTQNVNRKSRVGNAQNPKSMGLLPWFCCTIKSQMIFDLINQVGSNVA